MTGAELTASRLSAAVLAILLVAVVLLPFFHVGFQASDDAGYLGGGLGWLEQFPYVGRSHWQLRHTITLPVAASVALFGLNEFSVSLTNIVYFLLFLAVNTIAAARVLGLGAAVVSGLLLVTMPGVLVIATYLSPDVPELFYLSLAFWAFVIGCRRPESMAPWVVCGAAWALAFLNRETALAFALFLGLLFLFRPIVPRSRYLLIAAAALPLLVLEWGYLFAATGDPLYRYRIDFHHDLIDRAREVAETRARGGVIDGQGNLSLGVLLDPFVSLLVSQKYGIVFWLAAFAAWGLWKRRHQLGPPGLSLALVAAFGTGCFVFVAFNPRLYLVPRYLVVFAWTASLIAAYGLAALWRERPLLAAGLIAAALSVNVLGLMVENTNPRFAERELAAWVAEHPGQAIHADPETAFRSHYFFRFRAATPDAVSTAAPGPGATVFYTADGIRRCGASPRCKSVVDSFRPAPSWREVARIDPPESLLVRLNRSLGLARILPEDLARRLTRPVSPVIVYRVEPA
jgi:4-amino-4-deoxy-L-arabinose transferase-like glycosyltransferase